MLSLSIKLQVLIAGTIYKSEETKHHGENNGVLLS